MKQYFETRWIDKSELNKILNAIPELKTYIQEDESISCRVSKDLFSCIVHTIISQQITSAALDKIWNNLIFYIKEISPKKIANVELNVLNDLGIPLQKANTIKKIAYDILDRKISIKKINKMNDEQITKILLQYKGIGLWTVQNILIFGLYRNNICPINDYGVQKALKMLFPNREINDELINELETKSNHKLTLLTICLWFIANNY